MDASPLSLRHSVSSPPATASHQHGWQTASAHRTSEGIVLYVACVDCGARRVDLQTSVMVPPAAVSVPMPAR